MSYSAPLSAVQVPLAKPVGGKEKRSPGFFGRLIAWLQTSKPPREWDELAYVSDRMLADMGFQPDALPYPSELLMQKDVVRGLLHI